MSTVLTLLKRGCALIRLDPLTLLTGVLSIAAFAPWNLYPLIWVSLVPWFYAMRRAQNVKAAIIQGLWFCFFATWGAYYWMVYAIHYFGYLPWSLSVLCVLLFVLICQPVYVVFAGIYKYFLNRWRHDGSSIFQIGSMLFFAAAYTGVDWLIPKLWCDSMGNALYLARWIRQAADLGGVWLLTFLIILHNEGLVRLALGWRQQRKRAMLTYSFSLSLVLLAGGYGIVREGQFQEQSTQTSKKITAGIIQANIGNFEKVAAFTGTAGAANRIVTEYLRLSREAAHATPKPDFLVWPETAYPTTFMTPHTAGDERREQMMQSFVRDNDLPLLFGGYDIDRDSERPRDFNSLFILPAGGDLQVYHKNILLFFGEYMPGAETFEFIDRAFPQVGNFGRGPGPQVFDVPLSGDRILKINPIVCYEALIPSYVLEGARLGSELILNVTNDSWFGPHGEPYLHLALTVFRSIETRLPQLRATNTGISALILQNGDLAYTSGQGDATFANVEIPIYAHSPTLVVRWGDWLGPFALALALILGVGLWHGQRKITVPK